MFFRSRTGFLDQALIAQSILAHTHHYFEMKKLFHVETKIYSFVCSSLFLRPFDLFVAKHNFIPDSTSICDKKCHENFIPPIYIDMSQKNSRGMKKMYFYRSEIKITSYSYTVFYAFLRYIYTDQVELPPEDAIGEFLNIIRNRIWLIFLDSLFRFSISVIVRPIYYCSPCSY
jgi:hypothetical protein